MPDKRPEDEAEETQAPGEEAGDEVADAQGAEEETAATDVAEGQSFEAGSVVGVITVQDADEIARQASRSVSFRAVLKGPQVATNTDSQDQFKVGLTVGQGNLYELHQAVKRFANSAVIVTLTPLPKEPTSPHPGQLELGEGEEPEVELVMCPDCSGEGAVPVIVPPGAPPGEDAPLKCCTCQGEGKIPLAKLAETTFRLLECEGCGALVSSRDENQPGQACPSCAEAILAFVEPPVEEAAAEPAEEAQGEGDESAGSDAEGPAAD